MPLPSVKRLILNTTRCGKPVVVMTAQAFNHIAERVNLLSVSYYFIVQVRCYGSTAIANRGNGLSFRNLITLFYFHFVKVCVAGDESSAVIDFNVCTIPRL